MKTSPTTAAAAYGQALQLLKQNAASSAPQTKRYSQAPQFSEMLSQSVQSLVNQGRGFEQSGLDLVSGEANLVDVVTAASQTQAAMDSMVVVRDRVISAYEGIMRMSL